MKFLTTILLLLSTCYGQKYVANWTGWGHTSYTIQQGIDSLHWSSIGTVNGQLAVNSYQFTIPGANYYYRVVADRDSTAALFVPQALIINGHGKTKITKTAIQTLSVKFFSGSQLHFQIESTRTEQLQYSLYDITGRKLSAKTVPVFIGMNDFYDERPSVRGIYYASFQGYFDMITAKIMVQ